MKYFLIFLLTISSYSAAPKIAGVAFDTNTFTVYPSSLVASNGFFNETLINIRDPRFNADPSGVLDSTTNIQFAINYAQTNGFKAIYIPSTTNYYRITSQLSGFDNMILIGNGSQSKIYQSSTSNVSCNVMRINGKTNVYIHGVHFKANGAATTSISDNAGSYCGLVLSSCTNSVVENCFFTDSAYAGLMAFKSDHIKFIGNRFPSPGYINPYLFQSQVIDILTEDTSFPWIEGNHCVSSGVYPGDMGIATFSAITTTNYLATDLTIINNEVGRKTEYGILCYDHANGTFLRPNVSGNIVWNIDGSYHHIIASGITNADINIAITNVTFGTAAGDAFYMQNPQEGSVINNKTYGCGLFTRANGTLVKAAIAASGSPDIQILGNRVITNYYTGISHNNTGLSGDWTNRSPSFIGNTIIESGYFTNRGTIVAGSTNLTLLNTTLPLMLSETNWAMGGFWRGDKIVISGAGPAAADFEAQIFAITNGIVQLTSSASTSVTAAIVALSELSTTPPSQLYAISVVSTERPTVAGNTITRAIANHRGGSILITGTSGSDLMINPQVYGNSIKGGYTGINVQFVTGANIFGNSIDSPTIGGIVANNSANRVSISGNTIRGGSTGIIINSLNGKVINNTIASSSSGINSTNCLQFGNVFIGVTVPYSGESPTLDITGTNVTLVGNLLGNGGVFTNSLDVAAGKFTINSSGNITKLNNITYSWPTVQGSASTVLQNNGSGTLSWVAGGGSSDNWVASGSTNSILPGNAFLQNLTVTNVTASSVVGADANSKLSSITIGSGLSFSANTLSTTGAGDNWTAVGTTNSSLTGTATTRNLIVTNSLTAGTYTAINGALDLAATRTGTEVTVSGKVLAIDYTLIKADGTVTPDANTTNINTLSTAGAGVNGTIVFITAGLGQVFTIQHSSGGGNLINDPPMDLILDESSYVVAIYDAEDFAWRVSKLGSQTPPSYATLIDGATVTWTVKRDYGIQNAKITLGGNRTLAISGAISGMTGTLIVVQDGTGSRTLTLPGSSKVISGGAGSITLTTTAAAVDILTWTYDGTSYYWNYGKNYN